MYISQCLITKNEEGNIEHCLSHLKSVADEQIVVDTGSTDRTVEIAEKLGARVFHFEWINDFSAARNFALSKARGDWIIFLDCDEYFSNDSVPLLKKYMKMCSKDNGLDGLMCEMIHIDKDNNTMAVAKDISARAFKNKKSIRYCNKIHEVLYNSERENNRMRVADAGRLIKIYHTGYDKEVIEEKNKNERNINMIKASITENPQEPKLYYYLSKEYLVAKRYDEAVKSAYEALKYKRGDNRSFYTIAYNSILFGMYAMSSSLNEMKAVFDEAVKAYPEFPDYYRAMGLASLRENDIQSAILYFEECVRLCENYRMNVESTSVGEIERIYENLLQAYILADDKPKIVKTCAVMLNADKYNFRVLALLTRTFLSREKEESIVGFFKKIYDYSNFRDKMYLLKASEYNNNIVLVDFYKSLMSEKELKALG